MAELLPKILVVAGGLCLSFMLLALWQSLRGVITHAGQETQRTSGVSAARAALLREKETLLTSLRELRLEHELGKLGDADFQRLELGYRARAREVLRSLDDQLAPYRGQAEALLAKARGGSGADAAATKPAPASGSKAGSVAPVAQRSCASCGTVNDGDAVFCKKCGARMQSEGSS